MCPPVSPNTPLFSRMHVTLSPRAAVCSTSCSPSFTMSPSPWSVNTIESGSIRLTPVATDGARPCSACTRSTSIELAEARVAADAGDADRPFGEPELDERLEVAAHRERLAAARAHVVLLGEQQVGQQRLDDARRRRGRRVEHGPSVSGSGHGVAPPGAARARSGTRRCRVSRRAAARSCSARIRSRSRRRRAAARRRSRSRRSTRRR